MKVQVLLATMYQTNHGLIEKMNITTEAIVCNQCNYNGFEEFTHDDNKILWYSFNERGVGLNRNNALMRATGEICLFADDDMVYVDNYAAIINKAFSDYPSADIIVFNLTEPLVTRKLIKKAGRVSRFNFLRYGTARIAVRMSSIRNNGIYFNQCFGGGTEHCHGEDSLFLSSCLDKGLKIYACPEYIAELTVERESSWNKGYDDKYLCDQGSLYRTISRHWWKLLCFQDAVRRRKSYPVGWYSAYRIMCGKITGGQ